MVYEPHPLLTFHFKAIVQPSPPMTRSSRAPPSQNSCRHSKEINGDPGQAKVGTWRFRGAKCGDEEFSGGATESSETQKNPPPPPSFFLCLSAAKKAPFQCENFNLLSFDATYTS
jgi:hypothetical protein